MPTRSLVFLRVTEPGWMRFEDHSDLSLSAFAQARQAVLLSLARLAPGDERPPEKWDTCGGGPGRGLVGILWGCPAAHAAVHREAWCQRCLKPGERSRRVDTGPVAPDDMPLSARLPFVSCEADRRIGRHRGRSGTARHGWCCQVSVMMRS